MSQLAVKHNTALRMTTTKSYDKLNRLTHIGSAPSVGSAIDFNYTYNDANQRTRVNLANGSYWIYVYDPFGQVISGRKYWSDGTPVAGQQFEYAFDDIGKASRLSCFASEVERW